MNSCSKQTSNAPFWTVLILAWGIVAGLWFLTPWMTSSIMKPSSAPSTGDQFGMMNTLFSGLAFVTIAISLWYQRRDIQIQQQALIDQKQVFERQLRLAAVKEVVDSLPKFNFMSWQSSPEEETFFIENNGADVYNIRISLSLSGWTLNETSQRLSAGNTVQLYTFTYSHLIQNAPPESFIEIPFSVECMLRSGEVITLPHAVIRPPQEKKAVSIRVGGIPPVQTRVISGEPLKEIIRKLVDTATK